MTDMTGPRNDVLAERIEGLGRRFSGMEQRLGGLATKDELVALIQSRDQLTAQQFASLQDDIKELSTALERERAERIAGDRENEDRAGKARTFALSAIGAAVSILGAVVLLINNIGGVPS